jgi:hypothetical protein
MLNTFRSRWAQSMQMFSPRLAQAGGQVQPTLSPPITRTLGVSSTQPPPAPRVIAVGAAGQVPLSDALPRARAAFERCLEGLQEPGFTAQRRGIRHACNLYDLWHLRTGLYNEISRQFSQREAEQRLATLHGLFE